MAITDSGTDGSAWQYLAEEGKHSSLLVIMLPLMAHLLSTHWDHAPFGSSQVLFALQVAFSVSSMRFLLNFIPLWQPYAISESKGISGISVKL